MRVQLTVALLAGLVLVAVPLYLWRRPRSAKGESADAGPDASAQTAAMNADAATSPLAILLDASTPKNDIVLDKVRIIKCQRPGPGKTPPEQCDRQPFFEDALTKAVLENVSCAPKLPKGGTISFAAKIDHKKRTFHLWAGKSGTIRHKRAAQLIECVSRAIPTPNWDSLPHQHSIYTMALQATYPPSEKGNDKGER